MVSFLPTKRAFFISLDNVFSEAGTINCVVPQGSILGSLIFLLCINDIPQALSDSHTYLYADDTSIFDQHMGATKDVKELGLAKLSFLIFLVLRKWKTS